MTPETNLSRRSVLASIGGTAVAAAGGGAALLAMTGSAAAQSFTIDDFTASNDNGEVGYVGVDVAGNLTWENFDVPVEYIEFTSEIEITGNKDGSATGPTTLNTTMSDHLDQWSGQGSSNGWGGDGEYVVDQSTDSSGAEAGTTGEVHTTAQWIVTWDGTTATPSGYRTANLNIPDWTDQLDLTGQDGVTIDVEFKKTSTVAFYTEDSNGDPRQITEDEGVPEVSDSGTFTLTLENEASSTGGTTDGTSTAG